MTAIIQDEQIAALTPSLFTSRRLSPYADWDVRERFFRVYKPLRDSGMSAENLARIASGLFYYRPLLSHLLHPTQSKNVVEVGSGAGLKALCWADMFQSYVGLDLAPDSAAIATRLATECGLTNARFLTGNAEAILAEPDRHGIPRIDLLVLYAVLEHLTIPERKVILRLAQEVYCQGGAVLIAEAPNRLCRFDVHSWQLPFTDWLPAELLAEYAQASGRKELKTQLRTTAADRVGEKLTRIGRGISYHEFACFWDQAVFTDLTIRNDGYSVELLNLYPFLREEWDLLTFCRDNAVALPRMFTRYWIEGILLRGDGTQASKDIAYLPPRQLTSGPVQERRRFWEVDEVTIQAGGGREALTIENPAKVGREVVLLLDITRSSGTLLVEETTSRTHSAIDLARIAAGRLPTWHPQVALPLGPSPDKVYRLTVKAESGGNCGALTCHGALLI
ncbi:MAG TPA: class I SAM-dependent methyltransferase [Gemmataceae bacterium]|nr:class I SAM-dependent methyltransferase [Gemmataceae bacterium]